MLREIFHRYLGLDVRPADQLQAQGVDGLRARLLYTFHQSLHRAPPVNAKDVWPSSLSLDKCRLFSLRRSGRVLDRLLLVEDPVWAWMVVGEVESGSMTLSYL